MTNTNIHAAETADGLGTRLIVAYKQIPGNPMQTLVIKVDSIKRDSDRDELRIMTTSAESQLEKDFINYLGRKNLLKYYYDNGYFTAMDIDQVVMVPGNGQKIPLRTVIDALNKQNGLAPLPTKEEMKSLSERDPALAMKKEEMLQSNNKNAMAKNILIQAKLMQDEVNKKIKEAINLDPTVASIADRIVRGLPLEHPIKLDLTQPDKKEKVQRKTRTSKSKKAAESAN